MPNDLERHSTILFDERGLLGNSPYVKGQWRLIALHTDSEIRGFFGDYRFLSNFWPATVSLEGATYSCVENAYKAAKFEPEHRARFQSCTPYEALVFDRDAQFGKMTWQAWQARRVYVMRDLVSQKFSPKLNPGLARLLLATGKKYLEESNWWGDTFWGVHRTGAGSTGVGENTLGQLLMAVRETLEHPPR